MQPSVCLHQTPILAKRFHCWVLPLPTVLTDADCKLTQFSSESVFRLQEHSWLREQQKMTLIKRCLMSGDLILSGPGNVYESKLGVPWFLLSRWTAALPDCMPTNLLPSPWQVRIPAEPYFFLLSNKDYHWDGNIMAVIPKCTSPPGRWAVFCEEAIMVSEASLLLAVYWSTRVQQPPYRHRYV